MDEGVTRRRSIRKGLIHLLRLVILLLVVWGIVHSVRRAARQLNEHQAAWQQRVEELDRQLLAAEPGSPVWEQLHQEREKLDEQRIDWRNVRWGWLLTSGVLYAAGTCLGWWFWWLTLRSMKQYPRLWSSFRAYHVGQLGKYVPGKAMAVLLRAALIQGPRVSTWAAVSAVFVETLTFMAVGAAWGALLLPWTSGVAQAHSWTIGAVAVVLLAGVPALPALFRPLVSRLVRRRVAQDVSPVLDGIHWKLLATGWGLFTLGWWLVASSFWAASVALPGDVRPAYARLADLPRLLVAASLAVVLGFVSLLPGGVGVRELVIYGILAPAPHFGPLRALALAVVVRLIWLAAELLLAVPLYLLPCHPAASNVSQDELATHDRKHEESRG